MKKNQFMFFLLIFFIDFVFYFVFHFVFHFVCMFVCMFRIWELVECIVVLGFVVRTSKAEEAWGAS